MMRSRTRKERLLSALESTVTRLELAGPSDVFAESLSLLPVAAQDEGKKRALVKELRAAARQGDALIDRVREIASQLATLPIESTSVK